MNDRLLSFVTVNWRSADALDELAASLRENLTDPYELLVVNNDRGERDALERISARDDRMRVLDMGRNAGFAAGCNRGAVAARGNWLVFTNPDARVLRLARTSLDTCLERFGQRVIVAALLSDGERLMRGSVRRGPSFLRVLVDSLGLDRVVPGLGGAGVFYRHEASLADFTFVEQPCGAFFAVPRRLFESLGGFDERFFVFFDEVDLALRARWAGARIVLRRDIHVEHAGGHSTRDDRSIALALRWRSLRAFRAKHRDRLMLPPTSLLIGIEASRFTLQRLARRAGGKFSVLRALRLSRSEAPPAA